MMSIILRRTFLVQCRRLYSNKVTTTGFRNVWKIPNQTAVRKFETQPTTAFGIATVIVAVEKQELKDDLNACKDSSSSVVPPEPTEPGSSTTKAPGSSTTEAPGSSTTEAPGSSTTEAPGSSTTEAPGSSTTEAPGSSTTEAPNMDDWMLPENVIPTKYDLSLYPNLETGFFKGVVIATINVKENRNEIKIHSNGLIIDEVLIDAKAAKFTSDAKFELLLLTLADGAVIEEGEHVVTIKYNGDMKNRSVGLYTSSYTNEDEEKRAIATSKFEPTYARQAFPCFDEPNKKATYTVHILKPKDDPTYIALSNMPQEATETEEENGIMVHFQESKKMSTYLTCFIVCDFKYKETTLVTGPVTLRVYATPAQVEKTTYALDVAKQVTDYFWGYFDIEYPLPKLDLIAIPDFVSGAMEHWGLVTFRETALLYDEDRSSTANKQRIATVVSHELAHSWFGNLVTMDWWNDLWLNEGFASYIEYKGVDIVHPDWQMLDQFLIEDLHSVLSLDATPAAHPIVQTVFTPDQITEIFDTITYNKGASLLRMLESAIGDEIFKNGVTAYLKKYMWGNAKTQYLWDELQTLVGPSRDVTTFMDTWTVQMGYPILTVTEDGDNYVLTQKRFLKDSANPGDAESSYDYKWTIPVTYITDKDQASTQQIWFDFDQASIKVPKGDAQWIKFNHKQVGYYRVNYPATLWKLLADNIESLTSISDKTHLLEEAFSIAESSDGLLDYNVPLDLTKYLVKETNYIPWSVASTKLEQLRKYLIDSVEYVQYLDYVASIVEPAYDFVGWQEEATELHLKRRTRITILGLACSIGMPKCRQEALKRFQEWLENAETHPISQDLRSIVFTYGMKESGKDEWETLLNLFIKENDANEKLNLLRGLAAVKEPWLLRRLIELGVDDKIIRTQDYFTMLQYVSANPVGTLMVWDYVRENWESLVERFGLNDRYLGRLIPSITSSFATKTKLKEMEDFFEQYPEAGAGAAARKEALINVNNNIKWIARNQKTVIDWIKENANTATPSK